MGFENKVMGDQRAGELAAEIALACAGLPRQQLVELVGASSLTSAGHDASSGKVMSYRMEPQRHPPLILSGRVDMFFTRFTSVAATYVEDTLVCCLSLSLLLFCSVDSHTLLYVEQTFVALVVAWAPSELVLHRPKLCLRVRVRFAWLPP